MDRIKQWCLIISAVSIISGILISVVPEGKLKSAYKILTSIVLVYAFMFPLVSSEGIDFEIDDFIRDNYEVSENLDKYAVGSMVSSAEKAIEELLSDRALEQGLELKFKVTCEIKEDELKVISIESNGSATDREVIEDICKELGFDTSIIDYIGESNEH